jgi:hypothetical protein
MPIFFPGVQTPPPPPCFALLALCARAQAHPAQVALLRPAFQAFTHWAGLPEVAEAHGLVPLVQRHWPAAGLTPPPAIREGLLGYYIQHAHAARLRAQVLPEILARFEQAGIGALVLKGAALAHLVYADPRHRPMRDIDLLVPAAEVYRAYALLPDVGFTMPDDPHTGLATHPPHLRAIKRVAEGFSVSVEVHYALDLNERGGPKPYAHYAPTAQTFKVGAVTARALGPEAMLWHIYRHAFCLPIGIEPLRLIWVADLVSAVEAWLEVVDWERVRRHRRALWEVLPLLHQFSPWPERVLTRLKLPVEHGPRYTGWPRFEFAPHEWRQIPGAVRDSVFPPAWWLRAHYGTGSSLAGYWRAWGAHQGWLLRHMPEAVGRLRWGA